MRLLDRFLLRELLAPLGCCLAGFLIFWMSFNLFSDLDKFQAHQMSVADVMEYYFATTPELLVIVMPIALLLALLYALTSHSRHQELTAMRAAGLSLWRICLPYFAVGLLFSMTLFAVNELWAPQSADRADDILHRNLVEDGSDKRDWEHNLFVRNERDRRAWRIPAYNVRTFEMKQPEVIWLQPGGGRWEIYAERAVFERNAWTFYEVQETIYAGVGDATPRRHETPILRLPQFKETPELIRSEIRINSLSLRDAAKRPELSIRDISNYLKLHSEIAPAQRAILGTQLHGRLAAPWACLTVVLVAIPFGAASGRRNVFVGVAGSISLVFSYFVLQRLALALGTGGYLEPWIAAWLPNLFFGILGIVLIAKGR